MVVVETVVVELAVEVLARVVLVELDVMLENVVVAVLIFEPLKGAISLTVTVPVTFISDSQLR